MHAMRRTVGITLVTAGLVLSSLGVATAHDTGGIKGDRYTGVVGHESPGGVPMTAMSDIRCEDGMAGIFPCHKVDLASFTPLTDLGATFVNDVWGWEDPATGMQLAIFGSMEGTHFVDVTDGTAPVDLGMLPALIDPSIPPNLWVGGFGNLWGDIRVAGDTAYIVTEAATFDAVAGGFVGGMQVVDLTQFSGATGPVSPIASSLVTDFTNAHNVAVNQAGDRLYVVGAFVGVSAAGCTTVEPPFDVYGGGPIVYDVSVPSSPVLLGCFEADGYTHDIQCVTYSGPDADHQGSEICFASNEDTLTIIDATGDDPSSWTVLGAHTYLDVPYLPPSEANAFDLPNYYTHQGWISEDHRFFFLGDELDEFASSVPERTTYIWDLRDLDDVQVIDRHSDGNTSIDHNIFVHEGLLYQSNYSSGLWVYDGWKAMQGRLTMRGYFDVFPADDRTDFYGTWGNYPYFGDGKVVVTSSDEGLFVLQSRAKSSDSSFRPSRG